jgi:hypothetical protein
VEYHLVSDLSFWAFLILLGALYWFVTAPIAVGLAILGWYGRRWLGRWRWVVLAVAALLAAPVAFYGLNIAYDQYALQRALDRDETVKGVQFYAGSTLRFYDRDQKLFESAELRRVTNILGVPFIGTITLDGFGNWEGTLAADQTISGWPCRSGRVGIENDGTLWFCHLASAHSYYEYELPAGTMVNRGSGDTWLLDLPRDKGVAIRSLSATAPPDVTLTVTSDGRLKSISRGLEKTIIVHDVSLQAFLEVVGTKVRGKLAKPSVVAGEQQSVGTRVSIDLAAGTVSLAEPRLK